MRTGSALNAIASSAWMSRPEKSPMGSRMFLMFDEEIC